MLPEAVPVVAVEATANSHKSMLSDKVTMLKLLWTLVVTKEGGSAQPDGQRRSAGVCCAARP